MSQTAVTRFFHTKKRGIEEDSVLNAKNKVICLERSTDSTSFTDSILSKEKIVHPTIDSVETNETPKAETIARTSIRQEVTSQRITRSRRKASQDSGDETPKIVTFFKRGNLSPQKKMKPLKPEVIPEEELPATTTSSITTKIEEVHQEAGMVTPKKQSIPTPDPRRSPVIDAAEKLRSRLGAMTSEEIRKKLKNSSRLADLKTSLNKLQSGLDRLDRNEDFKMVSVNKAKDASETSASKSLKTFKSIELEVVR